MTKFLQFSILFLLCCSAYAGDVIFENNDQRWELIDVRNEGYATVISCDITIRNNHPGCFDAHKTDRYSCAIYLEGAFGRIDLYDSSYTGNYEPWIESLGGYHWDYYDNKNKGCIAHAKYIFPRIPAGIKEFDFHFRGGKAFSESDCGGKYECPVFDAKGIKFENNYNTVENSGWNESSIIDYFRKTSGLSPIEGIYAFYNTSNTNWWGNSRHRIAIIKSKKVGYDIVYLSGSNPAVWYQGEIKGNISKTEKNNVFIVNSWIIENKLPCEKNMFIRIVGDKIQLYDSETNDMTTFIKMNLNEN